MSTEITTGSTLAGLSFAEDAAGAEVYIVKRGRDLRASIGSPIGIASGADVEALKAAQQTSAIYATSWNTTGAILLESKVPEYAGQGAFVPISDTASHVDPATGATVTNAGGYTAVQGDAGLVWTKLAGDVLANKADVSLVQRVAGVVADPVENFLEIDQDPLGNVAFAVHLDGTREFLKTKVGGLSIARIGAAGAALEVSGELDWRGAYIETQVAALSGAFADALEIHVDEQNRVGYVKYADGTEWRVGDVDPGGGGTVGVTLLEMISLPDSQHPNANGGFTCTGLVLITTGNYRGCWLVGNDGRVTEGSSVFYCGVLILSPDMRRVVREIACNTADFPGIQSIQGVAWDSSDSTIWFVDKTNKTLRHIDVNGAKLGDEIVVGHTPNALAYIATEDALVSPGEGTAVVHVLACGDGSTVQSLSGIATDADHVFYGAARGELWASRGSNGSDGQVVIYSWPDLTFKRTLALPGSQSIEGIYFDGSTLTVVNDGAFHVTANPPLALANKYSIKGI